jgi:hypothetical protein
MVIFFRTTFHVFTIWLTASLLNAILTVLYCLISGYGRDELLEGFGLVLLISLLFSIPGILIFWLLYLFNYHQVKLFQVLFKTALFTSLLSGITFFMWIGEGFKKHNAALIAAAVIAATLSVSFHYNVIVKKN